MEPEDVDLVKDMSKLAKRLARACEDIVNDLHSQERTGQLADEVDEVFQGLRDRMARMTPSVVESYPVIPRPFSVSGGLSNIGE